MLPLKTNIYGQIFGLVPGWLWVVLIVIILAVFTIMFLRMFSKPATGTTQQQRDRSGQWARAADVEDLILTGPDSRRLPLGTLARTRKKSTR